ncbi:cell division protein FtsQ/DivIB [Sphingomonas sp.]|uniref:cell division protein FtsQ/DivIB n=1 Tax=Sphingomonas sp. TaxID=28214 RepID=UPI0026003794|nr:cell division protein FtsQ/DivIB [Sphingomonas sp.]MBV9527114.1 cell division protein FtsQ/DivIB [Sphingomonas sp.]
MSAAHVRRGGAAQARQRKGKSSSAARRGPDRSRVNKVTGIVFGGFLIAIAGVTLVALDVPARAARSAGAAMGEAGFTINGYQITGLHRMARAPIDAVVADELHRAASTAGTAKAPQTLVSTAEIRDRLLGFGWIKDARVSRRLPDTLVIDVVERTPAALWQDRGELALVDANGVVLDRVPVDKMPDLPLLIGPGANGQAQELSELMAAVPTLKPQLASATWVGGRRWDLNFQTGETVALPEGEDAARVALTKFARVDKSTGLLGHGMLRFDLRIPGKMIVRLPHGLEPITGNPPQQEG